MPIQYLRRLTSPQRTDDANRRLGQSLAFVAGAANAGGFLAVKQYTSHMSGIVSAMADDIPELRELVCEPVLASARGAEIIDTRLRVGPEPTRADLGPRRLR